MNVTDLLLQMTYAAGQIAQNTLPGGGAAGQSGGRSDFQSLLEDKRAEAGQTPETPAERPAEDLDRPVQDRPSQGETQEEYALVQSAALFLMPTLQMPAQVQPAPETGNGMQTAELGGISGQPVPLPAEAGVVRPQNAAVGPAPQDLAAQKGQPAQPEGESTVPEGPQAAQTAEQPVQTEARGEGRQETGARNASGERPRMELDYQTAPAGGERPLFRETEQMPVKVGETLDTQSEQFDARLTRTLSGALEQGLERVELKLSPEHLGNVVVEMTRGQDGTLHVLLRAENEHAAKLLSDHSTALGLMLQGSSQGEVRVEVQRPQQNEQPWQQQNQQNGQQQGQPREQRQQHRQDAEDFLHQLRLGLIQVETERV